MKLPVLMHLLHTLREGWPFSKLSTFQLIKKFNKASPEKRKKESNYSEYQSATTSQQESSP